MKALVKLATLAVVATALAVPASAQIISTSLPTAKAGGARDKFSMHIMATPFAWWDYSELYYDFREYPDAAAAGTLNGDPTSDFMVAGEFAVALGDSNWSLTAGGWYNKIGKDDFKLDGYACFLCESSYGLEGPITADIPIELDMYEGHVGIFYKSVGVQGGVVKTDQRVTDSAKNVVFDGVPLGSFESATQLDSTTTDWTVFGVFRKSADRFGISVGAGAYFKQGLEEAVIRSVEDKVVFSAFVTGNLRVFKGLGIDVSYWYVGPTDESSDLVADLELGKGTDSQSRFTVGIGYSF